MKILTKFYILGFLLGFGLTAMANPPQYINGALSVDIQLSVFIEPMAEVASASSLVENLCHSDFAKPQDKNLSTGCRVNAPGYSIDRSDSAYLVTYTPI